MLSHIKVWFTVGFATIAYLCLLTTYDNEQYTQTVQAVEVFDWIDDYEQSSTTAE